MDTETQTAPTKKILLQGGTMASLGNMGLYFDELNKIRIWDPDASSKSIELNHVCNDFIDKITDFNEMAGKVIATAEDLAQHVDRQKIKAFGTSNALTSMSKEREAEKQQYQALIAEKTTELERLRTQRRGLQQTEAEQTELLVQLQQQS